MTEEDKKLIAELGFNELEPEFQAQQIEKFYETLNLRIYMKFQDWISEDQAEEFAKLGSDQDKKVWFEKNIPDYKDLAQNEQDQLIAEIKHQTDLTKQDIEAAD